MQTQSNAAHVAATASEPHKTAAKPISVPRGTRPTPGLVESIVLRIASTLGRDARRHPAARQNHATYLAGGIDTVLALGLIAEHRALVLRTACSDLLDGTAMPDTAVDGVGPADAAYARVIAAVRRAGGASMTAPAELAELGIASARDMLARLQADGVIEAPDMLGHCPLRVMEA